jgi:hypothetical protein
MIEVTGEPASEQISLVINDNTPTLHYAINILKMCSKGSLVLAQQKQLL